jgi:hypothetical protein
MPYHSTKNQINRANRMGNKKKNNGKLDEKTMEKLREHSKQHEGGMNGKHMKNMIKFIKQGMSFTKAHNEAKKLDKK